MTFKHTKFEDSPIMRSLEKVAREKGLVKEEPMSKTASAPTIDLTPSDNLMSNILKLCAGLRAAGFGKYASELELSYLGYKKANTLYETSKEKGDDLVDAAHPKGSHKVEGLEGDAEVETILDQHLKMLEVVNKKPSGKLASSSDILGAVKTILADYTIPEVRIEGQIATEEELSAQLDGQVAVIQKFITSAASKIQEYGKFDEWKKAQLDEAVKNFRLVLASRPFTNDTIRQAQEALRKLQSFSDEGQFESGHWYTSEEQDKQGVSLWNTYVAPHMTPIISGLNKLSPIVKQLENIRVQKEQGTYKAPVKTAPAKTQFLSRIKVLLANITRGRGLYPQRVPANRQAKVKTALDNWESAANTEKNFVENLDNDELETNKDRINSRITNLENWVNEFMTKWLGEK